MSNPLGAAGNVLGGVTDTVGSTVTGVTDTVGDVTNSLVNGLKATINNPSAPVSAKKGALQQLEKLGVKVPMDKNLLDLGILGKDKPASDKGAVNVDIGGGLVPDSSSGQGASGGSADFLKGYISTFKDQKASKNAKEHAKKVLQENGVDVSAI